MRASHLHFMVTAPGHRTLVTHIFVAGDELLDSDTVFGVKDSLIKDFVAQPPGTPAPDGRDLSGRDGRGSGSTSCWRRQATEIAGACSARLGIRPARRSTRRWQRWWLVVPLAVVVAVAVREVAR